MTTFTITDVYTSRMVGLVDQPYTPVVGESYRITVEFDVEGTPQAKYPVSFQMADRFSEVEVADLTTGHKRYSATFSLPLDGAIPWEIEIDPYQYANGVDPIKSPIPHTFPDVYGAQNVSMRKVRRQPSKAIKKGVFEPAAPPKSIDYYDAATAFSWQNLVVTFDPTGKLDRMVVMMGCPTSESWQQVKSASCSVQCGKGSWSLVQVPVDNPSHYPVYYWDQSDLPLDPVTLIEQCKLELSNVRVDRSKLRTVSWNALDDLRKSEPYKSYAAPEDVVESSDPKIAAFVSNTLGADYRQKLTPYDAARKLFQAVVARTTYYYPLSGQPDLRPPTAVGVLDKGFGDCGGFSILLVAVFRNIGFAARTACGAWIGLDAGHCWCELFFPGNGWVLCDGSGSNGLSESGEYAYLFGNLPDLRWRYANMRGNTFKVGAIQTGWLQGPWQNTWGSAKEKKVSTHTILLETLLLKPAPAPAGQAIAPASTFFHVRPELALRCCPCARHGGFSPQRRPDRG